MTKKQTKTKKASWKERFTQPFLNMKKRGKYFLSRRPHRSFKLTRRRDYKRPIKIKGYIAFTREVFRMIWQNKRVFGAFLALYAVASIFLVGLTPNENYRTLGDYVSSISDNVGGMSVIAEVAILFGVTISGSLDTERSEVQQLLAGFLFLFGWLVVVWILRQRIAGHFVKLRDAIYSAGAPIVPTFVIFVVILVQSLPFILGVIAYAVLTSVGMFQEGVEAMLAWTVLILLATLSLYWITSSLIALVIITLPGMYPFKALKTAGDLVVGRRREVMMRLVWLLVLVAILWIIVLPLVILLDQWISIAWIPLVPVVALVTSAIALMFISTYVYLLYRRLIDDDAKPA